MNFINSSGTDGQAVTAGLRAKSDGNSNTAEPLPQEHADGRVLTPGRTKGFATETQAFTGLKDSFILDPATQAFARVNDSIEGHWYPTLTKLGNGDVYAAGGHDTDGTGSDATELFRAGENRCLATIEALQAGHCSCRPIRTNT